MATKISFNRGGAYIGTDVQRPPETWLNDRDPTKYDAQGYRLFDEWLNTTTNTLWFCVSLKGNSTDKVPIATWVKLSSGSIVIENLVGNTGGPVGPNGSNNINVVGDGVSTYVTGTPGTNTELITLYGITQYAVQIGGASNTLANVSSLGTSGQVLTSQGAAMPPHWTNVTSGTVTSLTGDDAVVVMPTAGNINVIAGLSTLNSGSSVEFTGSGSTLRFNVTDANNNTIIGKAAGKAGITGTDNTVYGMGAGAALTSGSNNSFSGFGAGSGVTTGSGNLLFGRNAGSALTTESECTLFGHPGIVGKSNLCVISSGFGGTTFLQNYGGNTFLGNGAGNFTVTSIANSSLGNNTLQALTSGTQNTANGGGSLEELTTGSNNTAIGFAAGSIVTGSANTFVGSSSGTGASFDGSNNTFIGAASGGNYTTTESNNICIGYGTGGTVGESNTLRIGTGITSAYIQGIAGVALTTANIVTEASNQLGTAVLTAGTHMTIDSTSTPNQIIFNASSGGVTGPATSTNNAIATWNGTGGSALFSPPSPLVSSAGVMTNPNQPLFQGYLSASETNISGDSTTFIVGSNNPITITKNQGSYFTTSGIFTAPVTGTYFFNFEILTSGSAAAGVTTWQPIIVTSAGGYNLAYQSGIANVAAGGYLGGGGCIIAPMTAGDTCHFSVIGSGGTKTMGILGGNLGLTFMGGYLIC